MKLSVVIPVYNVAEYLNDCLSSLVSGCSRKNVDDVELILVDDGSTDESRSICDLWEKKYTFIKVFHQKNAGLSAARNKGIELSKGEYISLIDSDDLVSGNFIDNILFILRKNQDIDLLFFKYKQFKNYPRELKKEITENLDCKSITKKEAFELVVGDVKSDISLATGNFAWNKIYSAKLFRDIKYPVGRKYEDVSTTYKLVNKANKVYIINSTMYYYRINPNSITSNNTALIYKDWLNDLNDKYSFFYNKRLYEIAKQVNRHRIVVALNYMHCYYNDNQLDEEYFKKVEVFLNKVKERPGSFRWRIELLLFKKLRYVFIRLKK